MNSPSHLIFWRLNTPQLDPIIGRIQRSTGRASSASAGTPFFNSRSHIRAFGAVRPNHWASSANRRASIISISWNSVFDLLILAFEHTAVRPNHWTISANHRASIISISWNSVFQLTLPYTRVWTHPRVAVRPNHWASSANR